METESAQFDARAFGFACGVLWAGAVVVLGITSRFGWGRRWQRLLADVYRGYDESVSGLVLGALWAFVDGMTGGYTFAWLYNRLRRREVTTAENEMTVRHLQ
jgi:hypothetical protein